MYELYYSAQFVSLIPNFSILSKSLGSKLGFRSNL